MKYLLMICADAAWEEQQSQAWHEQLMQGYTDVVEKLQNQKIFLDGRRLSPVDTATTIQVRNGETLVSDGPFAETKEQLGGYFLVDCRDLDHATEVATMIPSAQYGTIEIRPLWYQDEQ